MAEITLPFDVAQPPEASLTATADDIRACFRLLLGREPSVEEWPGHSSYVGAQLEPVVRNYLSSLEHKRRMMTETDDRFTLISIEDRTLCVYADDMGPSAMMMHGSYEPEVTSVIRDNLRTDSTFLDVGANVGYYAMIAAGIVADGRVVAVEPSVRNVRALQASAAVNGFENITIINAAATAAWELLAFGSTGTNGSIGNLEEHGATTTDIVQGIPLDDALASLDRLDLVKIDVEGAEMIALQGCLKTLQRFRPVIVSEYSPPALQSVSHASGTEYLQFLTGIGYHVSVILPSGALTDPTTDHSVINEEFRRVGSDHIDIVARRPA